MLSLRSLHDLNFGSTHQESQVCCDKIGFFFSCFLKIPNLYLQMFTMGLSLFTELLLTQTRTQIHTNALKDRQQEDTVL